MADDTQTNSPTPEELAQLMARYKDNMAKLTTPVAPLAPGQGVLLPSDGSVSPSDQSADEMPEEEPSQSDSEQEAPSAKFDEASDDKSSESEKPASEPKKEDTSAPVSELQRLIASQNPSSNFDANKELNDAKRQRDIRQLASGLAQAGNLIGSGLASAGGAQVKPLPEDVYSKDYELANKPIEDYKAKMALQGDDPNSEVSKAAQSYAEKLGIKLPGPVSANTLFKILPIQEKLQANQENAQSRRDVAKYRAEQLAAQREASNATRELAQSAKKDKSDTDRIDKAGKLITAEVTSSRSSFGKAANTYRAGEALEQLAQQAASQAGGLDNRQMAEVARNLDSMLSNGQPTVSGMDKLIPSTATGDLAKLQEYIGSIPAGAQQQQFLQRAMDTVKREKDLAHSQMQRTQAKLLAPYADLKDHPGMKFVLEANDLPEDLFDKPSKKDSSPAQASSGGFSLSDPKDLSALQVIMKNNPGISQQDAIKALVKHKRDQGY